MTIYHSILRSNDVDPRLKWMILLSLAVHLVLFSLLIGKPPQKPKKVFFSPTYSVNLVSLPAPAATSGSGTGRRPPRLWKGPASSASRVKTMARRTHTILTIPKKNKPGTGPSGPAAVTRVDPAAVTESALAEGDPAETAARENPSAGATNLRFSRYYTAVYNKIYHAWILPGYGSKKNLEAIVNIRISRNGKILKMRFEQRSSNAYFDRSVLRAIKKADPLPPLPQGFNEPHLEIGIRFIPEG